MEDAGAGAVVLFSLFEEQLTMERSFYESVVSATSHSFAEALDFFPDLEDYHMGAGKYLDHIQQAKKAVDIPIIASLNGITNEGWIEYARQIEQAGADALEINVFYIPADIRLSGAEVEEKYLDVLRAIKQTVRIPLAIKLNPYFSATGNMALRFQEAGADALVLFNRFYQPDFDIDELRILQNLHYSQANEIRLPLLWIAVLYGKLRLSLAATSGVQSASEVIKYLLAGADVVMSASALYKYGIHYLDTMHRELKDWMRTMNFHSVEAFRGIMSQQNISDPSAYERANYIQILTREGKG